MNILFIGDIVGKPGRQSIGIILPRLKQECEIDFVIANGENAAGGFGITAGVMRELKELGIDMVTGGNHIWDNKDIYNFIESEQCLLRPINYPAAITPGRGSAVIDVNGKRLAVLNANGRIFMSPLDCPFRTVKQEVNRLKKEVDVIVVDFHAEATSEKVAMGWHLDGDVNAVIGTHTHVQTADERLLPQGTAYITDVGMTGPYDSIIGLEKKRALERIISQLPGRLSIASGRVQFNAVLITIDSYSNKTLSINRINRIV
jgi:metallophosphoesterase (TIGR00282 family)